MLRRLSLMLLTVLCVLPAWAAIEDVQFNDDAQKARYQALIAALRCPMCLNANLAGSDAPIAADLRAEVHKQILADKSDDEILDFLVERYGEFILYKPRLHVSTALLWFAPPLLLLAGFIILRRMLNSTQQLASEDVNLNAQEQQQLQALLRNDQQLDKQEDKQKDKQKDEQVGAVNG
jgi:cytochrome c-type biogenesis protein CcmH